MDTFTPAVPVRETGRRSVQPARRPARRHAGRTPVPARLRPSACPDAAARQRSSALSRSTSSGAWTSWHFSSSSQTAAYHVGRLPAGELLRPAQRLLHRTQRHVQPLRDDPKRHASPAHPGDFGIPVALGLLYPPGGGRWGLSRMSLCYSHFHTRANATTGVCHQRSRGTPSAVCSPLCRLLCLVFPDLPTTLLL